jgi:uncharacterized protein (DUF2252 family)
MSVATIGTGGYDAAMTIARDPLAEIIRYNRQFVGGGRDPQWLRAKLDRLCASPFGFLRGTFHLFCADWINFGDDPFAPGAPQPIVGDLHLENFGAFRGADGNVVFDVNDFDETGTAQPAIDLSRVATSFLLADERHGELRAVDRIGAFLDAYGEAARSLDLRPIDGSHMPQAVKDVIAAASDASRFDWLAKRVVNGSTQRQFIASDKYIPVTDAPTRQAVIDAVHEFGARCGDRPPVADWPHVLDVAVRIAGTGSLGRFRWAVLIQGKSEKVGKERILELKEALPSSLAPDAAGDPAEAVIASQRRLQGSSPAFLGVAHVAGRECTVRELQPTEAKLDSASVKAAELDALCGVCGTVLGRMHRRSSHDLPARFAGRERAMRRRIAAFALRYAEVVADDFALLRSRRHDVESKLGL